MAIVMRVLFIELLATVVTSAAVTCVGATNTNLPPRDEAAKAEYMRTRAWQWPLIAAHRGGYFGAPNTLEQFTLAARDGVTDILEMDLHASHDGIAMVFHDDKLDDKTICSGAIESLSSKELASCEIKKNGFDIPSFQAVLESIKGQVQVDAEFKTDAVIAPAIAQVKQAQAQSWVYFQVGSNRQRYELARKLSVDVRLQYKSETDADLDWALSLNDPLLITIEMDRDFITPLRIRRVHDAGKMVSENSWRYQFTEEQFVASCNRAFEMGVNIVVTNNPMSCAQQRVQPERSEFKKTSDRIMDRQFVRTSFRSLAGWIKLHPHSRQVSR